MKQLDLWIPLSEQTQAMLVPGGVVINTVEDLGSALVFVPIPDRTDRDHWLRDKHKKYLALLGEGEQREQMA